MDKEDAKYYMNRFNRYSDSSEQGGESDNGDGAANDEKNACRGGEPAWWCRRTRYGDAESEDSDDFIVDG